MRSSAESPNPASGFPRYLTTFIGREQERRDIRDILVRYDVHLLTLLGPGGSGKTRLAVEIASDVASRFTHGTIFISFESLHDPNMLVPAIAQAVGVHLASGRPVLSTMIRALRDKQQLIVLDNLETVVEASPQLNDLLAACPGLTMLVTSRTALRVSAEHIYRVSPLTLADDADMSSPSQLVNVDSIRLFIERSAAVASTFRLTPENAAEIIAMCRMLDGLPLALELAAARSAFFSPKALLALLRQGHVVLGPGPRDAPARHRSMHDAIAWSYDLLTQEEQAVFRSVAVFAGGFSIESAHAVAGRLERTFETLDSLAANSLIIPVEEEEPRFSMLETLREYGNERLLESGEEPQARDRHASWFLDMAVRSEYAWCRPLDEGMAILRQLEREHGNFRAALSWLLERNDVERCLRMAASLDSLWIIAGHVEEGRRWLSRLLAQSSAVDDTVRARALKTLGWISNQLGDWDHALDLIEESLANFRRVEDTMGMIECLTLGGTIGAGPGDDRPASEQEEEAVRLLESIDGPDWVQNWKHTQLVLLGRAQQRQNSFDRAEMYFKQAIELQTARGYEPGTTHILGSNVIAGIGGIAMVHGDDVEALRHLRRSLELAWQFRNIRSCVRALADISGILTRLGQYADAAKLSGATEALYEQHGYPFSQTVFLHRAWGLSEPWAHKGEAPGDTQPLRHTFGDVAIPQVAPDTGRLAALWAEGRTLTLAQAVTEALAFSDPHRSTTALPKGLTAREIDVLRLIAHGNTNREIARTLSISERTVENHVTHILTKLGMESRTSVAVYAIQHGLA
jgi:predicted ATPase/DNA-binding CsgD family transcriptional regulator